MRERMRETDSLWAHLQRTDKPIYLYGMGNGAEKVLTALGRFGLTPAGIFASDGFVRGHSFRGMPVRRYSEVREEHGSNFIALLCFGINYEPMLSTLRRMTGECEFYAPDLPVVWEDGELFGPDYIARHESELDEVFGRLADEESRRVLLSLLEYKVSGKLRWLDSSASGPEEAYRILRPGAGEVYVDLGAYNGDTLREYLRFAGGCERAVLLEPDPKNFAKLKRALEEAAVPGEARQAAAWECKAMLFLNGGKGGRNPVLAGEGIPVQAESVDDILNGGAAGFLKIDVEGAERQAIAGARETLRRWGPRLLVSAYHRNEDLFAIPLELWKIRPDYRLYLRRPPYFPAWDTVYCGITEEKA